jgi:hypothetical protein
MEVGYLQRTCRHAQQSDKPDYLHAPIVRGELRVGSTAPANNQTGVCEVGSDCITGILVYEVCLVY